MKLIRRIIRHPLSDVVVYGIPDKMHPQVCRVLVGLTARHEIMIQPGNTDNGVLEQIGLLIAAYLDGTRIDLSGIKLAKRDCSPFADAVLKSARKVPYGATCSYSELAGNAGCPCAVRAAASVMRNNPWPLIVPCHRIIRKNGTPGAYNGDRFGEDAALKMRLLQMEAGVLRSNPG
jgi:O-6-methylguanine DNA methyltransferase